MAVKFVYRQITDEDRRKLVTDILVKTENREKSGELMTRSTSPRQGARLH